ncbi:MAG TPA: MarR family transcriptional regulator [Streptosporangiaceae bacterium]|nr:MarR family transcriptional regulator [Streptosporangiaceae bacterium]
MSEEGAVTAREPAAVPRAAAQHEAAAQPEKPRPGEPQPEKPRSGKVRPEGAECGPGEGRAGWFFGEPSDGPPADAPLHALLLAASRIMGTFYAGTLTQAGLRISPAGLGVLRVLLAGDGLKSSDVASRGWSSPGTLTSVVNTLVREGYVERRSDAGDRRVVRLFVTDKGRQVCEDYFAFAGPQWRDAFGFVDPADEPVIRKFFTDLIEHFSELIRKERGK